MTFVPSLVTVAAAESNYLRNAYDYAATYSQDPGTQVGAILITRDNKFWQGTNRFPDGVLKKNRMKDRDTRLIYMSHAEREAILAAARGGSSTAGATLYAPWYACTECAKAIISAGVSRCVGHKDIFDKTPDRWKDSISAAIEMMIEAGVKCEYIEGPLAATAILFNGESWQP